MLDKAFKFLGCLYFAGHVVHMIGDVVEEIKRQEQRRQWMNDESNRTDKRLYELESTVRAIAPKVLVRESESACVARPTRVYREGI